ncbi:hypothetical protein LV89_00522 [Arcicella aurantiaca]|uniref:Uncharacterized protein n=1 Tax=Arcicella aurantiaca TaxID=591202 RepID=A0A316EJE7_9BACT|nr:hypothetical protein [Arcicella aurantiaca]PWK28969.1 hypothetical protein LV89_00522 [Arcicella aurantiaca]
MWEDEEQPKTNPLFDLIGSGLNTVGQTIGTVVTSDNARKIAQTKAEQEKELAIIAAKKAKTDGFFFVGGIAIFFLFIGIIIWAKKPKYYQVGQSYALSGIHVPKVV